MPKVLSDGQIQQYNDQGFVSPIPILSSSDVTRLRGELEIYEAGIGHPIDFPEKSKSYLLFKWADELIHHPIILDAVEDVIGPDILVYHSTTWIKEPQTRGHVLWHQDGKYFNLNPHLHVTAWVALSEVSVESGCIHVLPGSHQWGDFDHVDDLSEDNMIKRGQGIIGQFDDEAGRPMPLKAGEMSLHHTNLLHCSRANNGDDRRIGLGISYIPASVSQFGSPHATALLVRGQARDGAFGVERRLNKEMDSEALVAHKYSVDLFRQRQDASSEIAS